MKSQPKDLIGEVQAMMAFRKLVRTNELHWHCLMEIKCLLNQLEADKRKFVKAAKGVK